MHGVLSIFKDYNTSGLQRAANSGRLTHKCYPMASVIANPFDFSKRGKKTLLYDYCQDDSRRDNACIFICTTSGRQTFARDISVDLESRMIALGGYVRWWDRLSLFGPVGVREVEVCVLVHVLLRTLNEFSIADLL